MEQLASALRVRHRRSPERAYRLLLMARTGSWIAFFPANAEPRPLKKAFATCSLAHRMSVPGSFSDLRWLTLGLYLVYPAIDSIRLSSLQQ